VAAVGRARASIGHCLGVATLQVGFAADAALGESLPGLWPSLSIQSADQWPNWGAAARHRRERPAALAGYRPKIVASLRVGLNRRCATCCRQYKFNPDPENLDHRGTPLTLPPVTDGLCPPAAVTVDGDAVPRLQRRKKRAAGRNCKCSRGHAEAFDAVGQGVLPSTPSPAYSNVLATIRSLWKPAARTVDS